MRWHGLMATPAPTQALSLAPVLAPFLAMLLAMGPAAEASPHAPPMDAAAAAGAENPPPYQLAPGDEIAVDFPYNAELNQKGPVGPDGRFAVPMLGSIVVAGNVVYWFEKRGQCVPPPPSAVSSPRVAP